MDSPIDDYSRIKTDSPWRWVPVLVGLLGFLAIGVGLDTKLGSPPNIAAWASWVALYLWLRVSRTKDGMADAFRISIRRARATGGVRINSRPWLARGAIALGVAMVATWIVVRTTSHGDPSELPIALRVFRAFGFLMSGTMLVLMGWARPWDLEVGPRSTNTATSSA